MFNQRYNRKQLNAKNLNNVNIYVEIGDSNAGGPVLEPGDFDIKYRNSNRVKIYYKPSLTSTDDGSWQLYDTRSNPINRRPGLITGSNAVGADQAFVYQLTQSNLKKDLRFFKLGIGGSTLTSLAGLDNDWSTTNGELFKSFVANFVRVGLGKLGSENLRNPQIKGIIIRLGTNDSKTSQWNQAAFIAAIPLFVSSLREEIGFANVPIYWVQIKSDLALNGDWNTTNVNQCRTAIQNCASGGATPINNFFVLNYDSLTTADGVHYDANSFITIGTNEGNTMINLGD